MARTGRWMAAIIAGLAALAGCTALADVALPWDTTTNIGAGGAAGVVIGAFLAVWAASAIEQAGDHEKDAAPQPAPVPPAVSTRQKVGEGLGLQIAPTGTTTFEHVTFNVNALAPPPTATPPDAGSGDGDGEGDTVVPPKA